MTDDTRRQRAEAIAKDYAHDLGCQQAYGGRCRCAEVDEDYSERLSAITGRIDAFGRACAEEALRELASATKKVVSPIVVGVMKQQMEAGLVMSAVSACRHCGEFLGHGHECAASTTAQE